MGQIRGYNDEANMKGRCLLRVVIDELAAATATEKVR